LSTSPRHGSELCPDCGEFVDELDEWTGYCKECTLSTNHHVPASRVERWLVKYADTVEFVMQKQNTTAKLAIIEVHATYKATCVICQSPIKHGTHGRHFLCNKTPECKKARRRYKYLIYDKGMSKAEALEAIIPTGDQHGNSSST
jgi:hypothetical protein